MFSKTKPLSFGAQHTHATHEFMVIKDNGNTQAFMIGTTSHGKSSDIPLNERRPETTIQYEFPNNHCPACGGTGKANVDEFGDIHNENPDNLDCGWCSGSGLANQ